MTVLRLVAYAPNGARLGPLPTPTNVSASYPFNDVGALSLSYPPQGPRSEVLGQPLEVATEVSKDGGQTWVEPVNGRFLYLRDSLDLTKPLPWQAECPGYLQRLRTAVVSWDNLTADGVREFANMTPGAVMHALITEAQARGALTGLTWTFTASADSSGDPWTKSVSIRFEPGRNLLDVLMDLVGLGTVDVYTEGRALLLLDPSSNPVGADATVLPEPVSLRYGRDLTEAPIRRTWEALADTAYVQGDDGQVSTSTRADAVKPWGRQEVTVSAGGVNDPAMLGLIGSLALSQTLDKRVEYTAGLTFGAAKFLPLFDYFPGTWVHHVTDGADAPEGVRVQQITLTLDGTRAGGNVVLNDRFAEQDVRVQRAIAALTGGATAGTSTPPSSGPIGNDILAPGKPSTPSLDTDAYLEGATPRAWVSADWLAVTTNADGTATSDVDHYDVERRVPSLSPAWIPRPAVTSPSTVIDGLPVGTTVEVRVRAVDNVGNQGAWSDVAAITTATDNTPPPTPTAPTASSRLGVVYIGWDGAAANGATMPADLAHVEVHVGTANGFTPAAATLVDKIAPGGGDAVYGPAAFGTTYYVRLVAVDTSGNASPASATASNTVQPLVDVSNFPDSAMETLYARTGHFIQLDADQVTANSAAIGFLESGTIRGAIFETTSGGEFRTSASPSVNGGIRIRGTDGFRAWNTSGTETFSIDTSGNVAMLGTLKSGSTITGATFSTATSGTRTEIGTGGYTNSVLWYSTDNVLGARVYNSTESFGQDYLTLLAGRYSAARIDIYGGTSQGLGGMVGITASRGLHVYGNIQSTSSITSDGRMYADAGLTVSGAGATFSLGATVSNGLTAGGGVTLSGGTTLNGGATVWSGLTVNGNSSFANHLTLSTTSGHSMTGAGGSFKLPNYGTVTNTGLQYLVRASSDGSVYAHSSTTSLLSKKQNVTALDAPARKLLEVEPQRFQWRPETLIPGTEPTWDIGVVADYVQALGPELEPWLSYDEDGELEGFRYDRWAIALQIIVREQQRQLDALEQRIADAGL